LAAYRRARRLGGAVRELRGGKSKTFASTGAGFRSGSGIHGAIERAFDLPPAAVAGAEVLTSRGLTTPLADSRLAA
jgi:AraC family transcriptional regulator of adaptative response/methylated-DNA-[protein]-cysteine methyltransferase